MDSDIFFMSQALELAEKGRLTSPPNPWVGCVIVRDGAIVGRGFHESPGKPHAEIHALEQAKEQLEGATAYVTLEPCCHHGRTPPCTEAIVKAKIKKVVIALVDPDVRVSGKGIRYLEEQGVEVVVGTCMKAVAQSLEPYIHHRITGLPFCILKAACSIDGKVAAANGTSKWITGELAREDVQLLRARSQAIMIGWRTALMDNPRLTARYQGAVKQPLRVVLDTAGNLPPSGNLFDITLAPTLIFTSTRCPSSRILEWKSKHVEVEIVGLNAEGKMDLKEVLRSLGKRGILQLLVEGGSGLHGCFLKNHLWQKLILYQGACVLGPHGLAAITSLQPGTIDEAPRFKLCEVRQFADDLKITYSPQ